MRRSVIAWSVIFGMLLLAFIGTVVTLNATLYSAGGFVSGYLEALARHDARGALTTPGVVTKGEASSALLVTGAMGDVADVHVEDDRALRGATRAVTVGYRLHTTAASTTFEVIRTGSLFGLFSTWRFSKTPLATLPISVQHDSRFTVNGLSLTSNAQPPGIPEPYLAFVPGRYVLGSTSTYLRAKPVVTLLTQTGTSTEADIDVQANGAFEAAVNTALRNYLAKCAEQAVLQPAGCPFGKQIDNRAVSAPVWSMVAYPKVTLVPGATSGTWLMAGSSARAHLVVTVQSLFDGTRSTFDEDVPFTVDYVITIGAHDSLSISVTSQ